MKIIALKKGKNDKYDALRCTRRDGSETSAEMPRQGMLPHDLVHFVVESALGYREGFLGLVAKGFDLGFAMQQAHDGSKRDIADQTIHAEAIVESLQAQVWSGGFDLEQFLIGVAGACAVRGRSVPDLSRIDPQIDLYAAVIALGERWRQVPHYASLELDMSGL